MAKKKAEPAAKSGKLPVDLKERLTALEVAQAKLDKEIGKGAVMCMGKQPELSDVEVIHTGSVGLDYALGVGGLPRGRVVEIFGPESSGKTTLAMHVICEAQKEGGLAAIIDAEHAFDRAYAEALGVDINRLWIAQPDNGEQALDIADQLINSGAIDVMVIDSVAALTPKAEIDGNMGDRNMGLHARLMSQAMRKLTSTISRTRTCCIFINQLREKIGVFMGNPEVTTGGNALKFYSSVRLEIRGTTLIKGAKDVALGRLTKVKVIKNKVAPPFTRCEFDIMFGKGISKAGEILDFAVAQNIVKKSGSWYSYGESKLGQGRDAVRDMLEDNPELLAELEEKVRKNLWESKQPLLPKSNDDDADADADSSADEFNSPTKDDEDFFVDE